MIELKFKCKLLSDIIINQKSATEGPNTTLDYIPGSNFLGIAAAVIYSDANIPDNEKWEIFHSGRVRFGDAHPSLEGKRSHRIPASIYYPKLGSIYEEAFIHHHIKDFSDKELKTKQLKQCRSGFFTFSGADAVKVDTESTFAIKSAHDRNLRKSMDQKMFGYQSLCCGGDLLFSVEVDNEKLAETIKSALTGKKKVGRSRSAQYGQIKISPLDFSDSHHNDMPTDLITVYADSRLIFLDDDGMPTFLPSSEQLGFPQGKILWDKSQIRTFCHAPYNYKRKCFDTDRCGIEKGSVLIIKMPSASSVPDTAYIGSYNNEGYGKVIYNPDFLKADSTGKSLLSFANETQANIKTSSAVPATPLIKYLSSQKEITKIEENVYLLTNNWINTHKNKFKDSTFASQWGSIRSIAMNTVGKESLQKEVLEYIRHGVASEKWKEHRRIDALTEFINGLTDKEARIAMVNLSSEMGKVCRKED